MNIKLVTEKRPPETYVFEFVRQYLFLLMLQLTFLGLYTFYAFSI